MSLKRKCDFDPIEPSSSTTFACSEDESIELSSIPNVKFIKTDQLLHRTSPSTNTFYHNNSPTDDHNERKSTHEDKKCLSCFWRTLTKMKYPLFDRCQYQ